jgi:prepilin peptidase CpaA
MEIAWWLVFLAFNGLVIFYDFRWRRVPNTLVLAGLAAQVCLLTARIVMPAAASVPGAHGWGDALIAFAIGCSFFFVWMLRVFGAGDVKYLAVLGLFVGVAPLLKILIVASLIGGMHSLLQVVQLVRAGPGAPRRRGVPYAAYLALVAISWALMQSSSGWASCFSSSSFMGC